MKKIFKSLLALTLIFSMFTGKVDANEFESNETYEVELQSEYSLLLDMISQYSSKSYLRMDINEYTDYTDLLEKKEEYINYIYNLKSVSIDELKKQNYTDDQIEAIKTFDGSDELAVRASAYVYCSAATKSSTSTLHGVRFSWSWMGTPVFTGVGISDGIAVRWESCKSNGVVVDTSIHSNTNAFVRYGNTKKTISYINQSIDEAVEINFATVGLENGVLKTVNSGVFDVYITRPSGTSFAIAHTDFEFKYGHSIEEVTSVSFSFPLSGGITIEDGEQACYKYWEVSTN